MMGSESPALILASSSPRRHQLLEVLGIPFEVIRPDTDESPRPAEAPLDFVLRVAREKGDDVAARNESRFILSADTIVSIGDTILGKPGSRSDAVRMLRSLSGRQHAVYTAVSLVQASTGRRAEGIEETKVWFRSLEPDLIEDYLAREDVLDKAGAYAIQGFAAVFISKIEGDYTNVIGLPLGLTYRLLAGYGLTCRTSS